MEKENALLLAACDVRPRSSVQDLTAPLDWPYLLRAADRQGATPLLYDWLQRHPEVEVEASSGDFLHDAYWTNHFRNRLLLAELARVCEAARESGVELMPLKGARLATDFYPVPALRPLGDLDLLVRPRALARFSEVLGSLGYREVKSPQTYIDEAALDAESSEHCWIADTEGFDAPIEYRTVVLELAFGRLTDLDRVITASLRQHALDIWARARSIAPGQTPPPFALMSTEDLLLQVATHLAAKHVDFRLIWLHDIARIVSGAPALDWDYVSRTTAALKLAAPVGAALHAAAKWVGAPIPPAVLSSLHNSLRARPRLTFERWDYDRLSHYAASLGGRDLTAARPGIWPIGSALSRLSGWSPRLKVLRWIAVPCRAYLADRGMESTSALGYVAASVERYVRHMAPRSFRVATLATKSVVAAKSPDRST